jgi:hypothetical protein
MKKRSHPARHTDESLHRVGKGYLPTRRLNGGQMGLTYPTSNITDEQVKSVRLDAKIKTRDKHHHVIFWLK